MPSFFRDLIDKFKDYTPEQKALREERNRPGFNDCLINAKNLVDKLNKSWVGGWRLAVGKWNDEDHAWAQKEIIENGKKRILIGDANSNYPDYFYLDESPDRYEEIPGWTQKYK